MKERLAKGSQGMIMRDIDGSYYFRMYYSNGSFTDYDLLHNDLFVEILDEDAAFKLEDTNSPVLDYSNQTLGIDNNE